MKSEEVDASESSVIQKDDDSFSSDTIVEKAGIQHALLKIPKSMDNKEEDISGDASEEVNLSPETSQRTAETIKACLPETVTAPAISSVDDKQYTYDDLKHQIPSAEKGDMESTLSKEQEAEIMQTSLQECAPVNRNDSIDNLEVTDVKDEKTKINAEVSQTSSMLLKPDIQETAEYGSDKMENENFSKQVLPPIEEKSIEQPFSEESSEIGNIIAQPEAENDSSMKTAEIQVQNKHTVLAEDQEGKSPQDLGYEKESDSEGMSPEDAQQISEKISESRSESCADEEAEPTSELRQSYQEVLEPSQIICEGANDSKDNVNDDSTEKKVTTSTEEMLVDSSSTIENCSKKIESEIYESKTISSEDGAYVDQLGGCATIEATEKSSQLGIAAEPGPANIQENDEHQSCQTELEENDTISEMVKQNRSFPESDSQEKNVISTKSMSYDNANMTNAALEGDNGTTDELKAKETGYSFREENVEIATREPSSSDQISSTDENSISFPEKGDSAISTDSDKISSLNENENMEFIDTEAKFDIMQEVDNNREIVVAETSINDISEEIIDESDIVSEKQVDSLTLERNTDTDETALIVDSRQNIPLPEEDQLKKLTDVREMACVAEGEKNSIEEEIETIRTPDTDTEKDSESNNEEIQNDSKPGQACENEPGIVKHSEIVNPEIEEAKSDHGEQNQENYIHSDALEPDGDAQTTFSNLEPTSPENHEVKIDERMEDTVFEIEQKNTDNVDLPSIRDVTSAENLEYSTNSAIGENNVTSEASINKIDDQNENENENQSLTVTCEQTGTEAEDTINKTDDSEKEIDLQYTEEKQSTRDATAENFQRAVTDEIEDHKNLENTNADPSQQHDEPNSNNSNYNEESKEFHSEDESNTEEAKNQVYQEESPSNKEGIGRTVEVSQSQDGCSKVNEDSIHVIEVEETTDKQHEEQEDGSPYYGHDGVLADQVKAMDADMDSQKENELNTSNSDGVHVQEDLTERDFCKNDEIDESDTIKDKEVVSQEFDQDKLVNKITSPKSSPPIEPVEHSLGAVNPAMDDSTASKPSQIVNDEALTVEASKAAELEAEQHIQTNEDPEQENDISADKEFQEMNNNPMELSENIGTESDNIEAQDEGRDGEGVYDDTAKTVLVTDPKIEGEISTGMPSQSGKLDQEINADNPVTSQNEGTEESTEAMQVSDIHDELSADCLVLPKEVVNQEIYMDPGINLQQENENTTSSDGEQIQEDQREYEFFKNSEMDESQLSHPEKDKELIIQGFKQDSISSEIPCQETSAAIEALSQDIGTAMDDHTQNEPSEIANDTPHIVEVSKAADYETEQHDQANEEPEHENEISAEEDMDVKNHEFIPESAELTEVNNTENEAINSRAADQGSNNVEDLSRNENTNSEISQKVTILDEDPRVNTEVMSQDINVENRELVPPLAELTEENNTENEAINSRAEDLGSNTVEDLSGNENTNLEISLKETGLNENSIASTEAVLQNIEVENHELIPESTELREENHTENEAINSRAADLDANTIEDLSGNENTNLEISQKVAKLDDDPRVNTEVVPQDMSVENRELVSESAELAEEDNIEDEASNGSAEDLGLKTAENTGNKNRNLEISQKEINTEVVLQNMDVENHEAIPESTELRQENNTENEAINSIVVDLGSSTVEDLTENENTNSEISEKVINLDEDPRANTEVMLQDKSVENRELVPESAEVEEEDNTENEAISSTGVDLGSHMVENLSGSEYTNSEISQKVTSLDEDPKVNTEAMPQDMSIENSELTPESAELTEGNNTKNEAISSRAEELGSNTVEDSGNENTNLEISQMEISLNENSVVNREVVLQAMHVENDELIPELIGVREQNNTENEAIESRGEELGSNTVEDLTGYENTNSEIPQKDINSDEDSTVGTEIVPQDIEVENHELIPESTKLREENNTENDAINIRAADLRPNTVEDLSGNENTNSEMSQMVTNLDEDPGVDPEAVPQDVSVENHGFISESTEQREENNTENEAVNSIAKTLGSNTVEDLSGNKNTNLEISQKEINLDEDPIVDTEVVIQDMSVENPALVQESTELTKEKITENEVINTRPRDLGSNTVEDSGNENTNLEVSQKEICLNENPIDNTDVLQDMDVENHELIPESTQLREENSTEDEAINRRPADLGSNTVEDLSGNEKTNSEMSQTVTNLVEDPRVDTEFVPQDMSIENHGFLPESTELREENNAENEAVNSIAGALGSNTVETLSGNKITNFEISQKEINLEEDSIADRKVVLQDMDVENHEFIPESTELQKEDNIENEPISSRAEDLGSTIIEDFSGKENTNLEISQKEISLNEDPIVNTEVVLQDMDVENHKFIPESTELIEENNIENEGINSRAEDLGSNTAGDLGGNENINLEISQKEINLDEDPIVEVEMLQVKEEIQVDEEPENTERESTQEGSQHTLTEKRTIDQEKPIDTTDAPQLENEEKTCMYDEHTQEVKETYEQCKLNEMNESVSSKNQECESHGFEDECNSKRVQNEQTPVHSEASEQNIGAEMPNQDNEECRIDASEVNNTEEVAEHDEHRNEALVDKIKEQEVICTNASSSGNEMDTTSSEVKNDETLLLPEQMTEPPPGISQTNIADQGPELGVCEQSIEGNEEDELDSNKTKFNMEMVVDSIEEIQHKDDREGIPLDQEDPNHFASQDYEIDRQPTVTQSGDGILTAIEPSQYIEELESNDAKQEENVSNVTNSSINGHDTDEMTADETVETQGKQPVEPQENFLEPSSPSEATSRTQVKEDSSANLKDLNKEKEEESTPEKATQRELQASSGFELCGDLPYIPAVEEVSKTEEYLVSEIQGANDPLDSEKTEPQSCTDSYSPETESEADEFQTIRASLTDDPSIRPISEKYGHTSEGVTENQEETKSPEQLIEPNNEEQTVEDIIDKRGHQAVESEMTVEENTVEENYESQGTPAYNTVEEKKEISIETKPLEEVDNIGDDTQSSRVEELKDENAYETGGCEGDSVTIEETVFHVLEISNSSHGNQGIDTNIEDENAVPIKDNYTMTSADDVMVAEDKHHGNTQSERTSITIDAGNLEEKQVPAGSVEIVQRSAEPVLFKESKKDEDEIMEEKEETYADAGSHEPEFYKIDNDAGTDEKTLSKTDCNTKSDECSITISKDSKEISKEPNILVISTSLEGEAVEENFQQSTSGERTENGVRPMEPEMDASELYHQMNVPKPDNMDVEEEKQQESAKGLECCSTLEPQQRNDRIWVTEMEVPEGVSSREIDSDHSEAKLKVDEIQSEGKFSNASDVHMDCQDAEKISAAEIIASHICQEIEIEDELKQPSSEHQKQIPETSTLVTDAIEKTFEEEVLHEESTENTCKSFNNPTEICAREEREIEHPSLEAERNRDLEQKQDLKEKHRTMDNSVRTDPTELSSEFQGVESSAEVKSDTEDSTLEMRNVKEVCHLNEKSETDQTSQFNLNSQPISGENPGNTCKISTDNHTKTESFEEVKELKSEKLAISDEIGNDTHLQTVKKELMGESSPLNFEVIEAVAPDAAGEEAMQDVYTTVSSEDHVLVQQSLPTTKSCDETEKPLIADEHSQNTLFSVSQVSGINNTPPTETNASEEKVSEQPVMEKVSNPDSNITPTMQVDKEEQLQGNYDDIPQSQLQDKCGKNLVNMRTDEHVDTVDVIYNGMNAEDFFKEGSELNTNEVPSLEPMQSLTTSKEEITAEIHNETEVRSMPLSTIGNEKGGEWVVVTQNPQDDEKRAADEPKTETGKEDTIDDLGTEDSELIPMISEASRDIELKAQNKKSHHILAGMGSKMKNSISKVKKAMACASPQFSPEDVIIKLNKSKKS